MRPNGDFQHLPSWRELVVATALSLRRYHADTLIVPMSLIRDDYRTEILSGLAEAGEELLHVFLEADAGVLRERLSVRALTPDNPEARGFGLRYVDAAVVAAARQPEGTLRLRSDRRQYPMRYTSKRSSRACRGHPGNRRSRLLPSCCTAGTFHMPG
jgi:predicted component of type VI protein secretion system